MLRKRPDEWAKLVLVTSLLCCGASLVLVLSLVAWHLRDRAQSVSSPRNLAQERAVDSARQIEEKLRTLLAAEILADELESGALPDEQVEERLLGELRANPVLSALTACYAPEFVPAFAPQAHRSRYCPFSYAGSESDQVIVRVEDSYDYTLPDGSIAPDGQALRSAWYHRPLSEGPVWGEPYFGISSGGGRVYWAGFGAPFYRVHPTTGERVPAGVVSADITLEQFQELLASVDLGKPGTGYGFIVSDTGTFISHPIREFIEAEKTLSDFDEALSIESLAPWAEGVKSGEIPVFDHVDKKSGRSSWVFFAPVSATGWWVGIVLDKQVILQSDAFIGRLMAQQVGIILAGISFLSFLAIPLFRAHRGTPHGLWAVSSAFSVLCIAGIACIWILNVAGPSARIAQQQDILLADRGISEKVMGELAKENGGAAFVPTGVLIQSAEFIGANALSVTGYIWQRYSDDLPQEIKPAPGDPLPGFVLPQASIIYSEAVIESYRAREGDEEVIGWYFEATLRLESELSKYPFDRRDIAIRIQHRDFGQGVMLAPDLVSYASTNPAALPGLEREDIFVEGWNIDNSFFSYRTRSSNTNFGIQSPLAEPQILSDLYFHLNLARRFVNAFITQFIPLAVVAFLLFAVLVTVTSREERINLMGFSASAVLAYCAALFFVVIISHLGLRSGLADPQGIIYLELFYFVIYGAILSVSVNSLIFTSRPDIRVLQYKDNIIMELLFWPIITGLLLIITLFSFL